jgi:hypothetical protein
VCVAANNNQRLPARTRKLTFLSVWVWPLDLLNDPSQKQTEDLVDRLARNVDAIKAMSKVSPNLSAGNNAALMVAASTLHKNLSESGERGWHETYRGLVKDMCDRCDLAANTIERHRKWGS